MYKVRPLNGEDEVEQWLDFVTECFAFKGVKRRHFATHFWSDPWRNARKILVAETTCHAAERVATLRIFDRLLYLKDGLILRVGGIGEVCTREDWQRKGLCRELLAFAGELMRRDGITLSCLHTSSMGAVYARCGFRPISESRVLVRLRLRRLPNDPADGSCSGWMKAGLEGVTGKRWFRARTCALPLGVDLPLSQLMAHHHSFHHLRFSGALVRDDSRYWESYITANMAEGLGTFWLQEGGNGPAPDDTGGGRLGAFASIRGESGQTGSQLRCFRLSDYCAAPEHVAADGGRLALETLLSHALHGSEPRVGSGEESANAGSARDDILGSVSRAEEILLKMPGPVADSMGFRADGLIAGEEHHSGTMYWTLLPGQDAAGWLDAATHVSWPVDGF